MTAKDFALQGGTRLIPMLAADNTSVLLTEYRGIAMILKMVIAANNSGHSTLRPARYGPAQPKKCHELNSFNPGPGPEITPRLRRSKRMTKRRMLPLKLVWFSGQAESMLKG